MPKTIDLIGRRFGRWTVSDRAPNRYDKRGYPRRYWLCKCDCGTEKEVSETMLKSGKSKSCGCLHREIVKETNKNKKKCNKYDLTSQSYGICYASNTNQEILFDLEDYDLIKDYCWRVDSHGYVVTSIKNESTGKYNKIIRLHKLLIPCSTEFVVDHKNTNKLDNQRDNLRVCYQSDNTKNHNVYKTSNTGVSGVTWDKKNRNWRVRIGDRNIGSYDSFENAVKAREKAEIRYFGEYRHGDI